MVIHRFHSEQGADFLRATNHRTEAVHEQPESFLA
jgi:hypothetical protein